MSFDSIIGQPFAVDLCRQWLKRQTTHPLLFYGPASAEKKALALELAKVLNCGAREQGGKGAREQAIVSPSAPTSPSAPMADSCGCCLSCRKIAAGNHPDVRVIDLAWQAAERKEPVEKQQNLRIETVLTERHRLLQSPLEGSWKVSIIDEANRLTPDAANVLLKVLEEPPTHTAIILVTPFRDRLLPTILSRCQPVRFRQTERDVPLTHEEIESHRQAEALWESLTMTAPARLIQAAEGRTRIAKLGRAEIEEQVQRLLVPAARALRAGDMSAQEPVRLLQMALTQLRQNVQPALVYDHLLLRLASSRRLVKA